MSWRIDGSNRSVIAALKHRCPVGAGHARPATVGQTATHPYAAAVAAFQKQIDAQNAAYLAALGK